MTWFRVPLACLVFAMVLAPFSAQGAPGSCPGVTDRDDWTTIQAPDFPEDPAQITAYAVHPYLPDALLVTNGKTVMASGNGGCSWVPAFTLDLLSGLGIRVVGPAATIRSIVIPEHLPSKNEPTPIYLLIEEGAAGAVARPHVVVSKDGGATWLPAENGLAPVSGASIRMRAAPSDPDTVYLLATKPGVGGGEMYATSDGGTSWEKRGDALGVDDFRIDPIFPDELWTSGGGGLRHSVDGGGTFTEVPYVANPTSFVDVFRADESRPARIMTQEVEGNAVARSDDGGKTWRRFFGPQQASISIAHGNNTDDVVLSTHLGFHRFQPPHYWIEIAEEPYEPPGGGELVYEDVHDLQVDRTSSPAVFGFTPTAIKRYNGFSIDLPPLIAGKVPETSDALLSASERVVHLEPGESHVVDYKLSLPPAPTPLDVYFVLDTTDSMESSIKGLTSGIYRISQELALSKVDVRFGLAEYKDYPIPGYGNPEQGDVPYRQKRDLGPADQELVLALESLQASGGGGAHLAESQLTALYQSATGEGEPGFVEPGQGASFRGDALKVIINITDAPFDNSPAHPSPPFDDVARELKAKGILQIGLGVYGKYGSDGAMQWLSAMADATGTVAPEAGVDCDGDGRIDIAAGKALVCEIADQEQDGVEALAPAIISTLRALVDRADVTLVPKTGAEYIDFAPPTYNGVNVKVSNLLDFKGTITCPDTGSAGGPIEVVATVEGETVAGTATKFTCEPVKPEKVVPAEEEPDPPLAIVPPAPVPQPAIVPAPPPPAPPAPVTQTQPQPNPHVQGALAQQEQDQVQVAIATNYDGLSEGEYAFSSYSRRSRGPGAGTILYMTALVMTAAAAGLSFRHRLRPSLAREQRRKT